MNSAKQPFVKNANCSIVGFQVQLSGVRVSMGGTTAIAKKTCSNVAQCLAANGSLEKLNGCLLHNLQG
jgi:hypothetical protein